MEREVALLQIWMKGKLMRYKEIGAMKSKCKTTEIKIHAKKTVHPTADSIYEDKL